MRVITTIAELRHALDGDRHAGRTVGLVPTMGYLHAGHASLIERAAAENDVVATTIFVNPLQFAPTEDLASYPRDLNRDQKVAEQAGATYLFVPPLEEMYPHGRDGVLTTVSVADITAHLDGASRPTHFDGVATVVAKLFAIAGPCRAYFGEKDYQQLAVVRRMADDLSFPVDIVGCPTTREPDGLAMSSRNAYLTDTERAVAPTLRRALDAGADAVAAGRDAGEVRRVMHDLLAAEPLLGTEYAEVADPATLQPLTKITGEVRLLVAARLGRARLIDNTGATPPCAAG